MLSEILVQDLDQLPMLANWQIGVWPDFRLVLQLLYLVLQSADEVVAISDDCP